MKSDNLFTVFMYVLLYVSGFLTGGYAWDTKLLNDEVNKDKKQYCITMYKEMPVETLADSFCDDYFKILRKNND